LGAWIAVAFIWSYAFFFVLLTAEIDGSNNVYRPSPVSFTSTLESSESLIAGQKVLVFLRERIHRR
jgi:hypothetical protein